MIISLHLFRYFTFSAATIIGVGGVRQQPLHGILNGGVSLPRGAERECRRGAERPCRRGQSAHAARGGGAGG